MKQQLLFAKGIMILGSIMIIIGFVTLIVFNTYGIEGVQKLTWLGVVPEYFSLVIATHVLPGLAILVAGETWKDKVKRRLKTKVITKDPSIKVLN